MPLPNHPTRIFLDSGNPEETRELKHLLGFLDGQTTNPTLVAKHPLAQERLAKGELFSSKDLMGFYRMIVKEISELIPQGSVSIEVYADEKTSSQQMIDQAREMYTWIPNAHIKLPLTEAGLEAAEILSKEGIRLNLTLCFSQQQAAAVYAATRGPRRGNVFLSPFVGRLDDRGQNGMDLIENILEMYDEEGDCHVEVLTASVRTYDHFMAALSIESDIITAPFSVLKQWAEHGKPLPPDDFKYQAGELSPIALQEIKLDKKWREYDFKHELTDAGVERFAKDWNALVGKERA